MYILLSTVTMTSVINANNKMITRDYIGRMIWIIKIIERYTDKADNHL